MKRLTSKGEVVGQPEVLLRHHDATHVVTWRHDMSIAIIELPTNCETSRRFVEISKQCVDRSPLALVRLRGVAKLKHGPQPQHPVLVRLHRAMGIITTVIINISPVTR